MYNIFTEFIKKNFSKLYHLAKRHKLLAVFATLLFLALVGSVGYIIAGSAGVNGGNFFCPYKVYEEADGNYGSKGDGPQWKLSRSELKWIKKHCPGVVWTSKEKESAEQNKDGEKKEEKVDNLSGAPSFVPACEAGNYEYTHLPLKEGDFTEITPLGNLNPSGHTFPTDHIYLLTAGPEGGLPSKARSKPLYSPGNIWITKISSSTNVTRGITDYDMEYYACKDVKGRFGHVGSLTEKLKSELKDENCSEYTTGGQKYKRCENKLALKVNAGEQIGTAGDGQSAMLDIWATDYRANKINFANPKRWGTDSFYTVCPVDHFAKGLRALLLSRFIGPGGGKRTKEPVCGTTDVDVKGTAQGTWFFSKTPGDSYQEDLNMALVPHNVETNKQAFSMGASGEGKGFKGGVYFFIPLQSGAINRDFSTVKPDGSVYCYNIDTGRDLNYQSIGKSAVLLTMPDEKTVRVEKLSSSYCGTGPWAMTNYVEFVR